MQGQADEGESCNPVQINVLADGATAAPAGHLQRIQ